MEGRKLMKKGKMPQKSKVRVGEIEICKNKSFTR